jgi:Cu/Ag efflux pump CusA
LASIRRETGPNQILREQVERKIVVQCNVSGRDVTGVVRDIQRLVDPLLARTRDYRVEYAGQFESAAEAGRTLTLVGVGVVIGIGFLLHLAFKSAPHGHRHPLRTPDVDGSQHDRRPGVVPSLWPAGGSGG